MTEPTTLLPFVEGQSDVQGVPVLLRRLLAEMGAPHVVVARPFRIKRTKVPHGGEVERVVTLGLRTRPGTRAILVLIDADDDPPRGALVQTILEACRRTTNLPVATIAASREIEAWFLGAKESIRGVRGIKLDANSPSDPESIRDAKGRLTKNMEPGRSYLEVDDQPAFAQVFDLDAARARCPSFQLLCDELRRLLTEIADSP